MLAGAPDGAAEDGLELDASLLRISAIEKELPWTLADIIPVFVGFETNIKAHLILIQPGL